MPFQLSIRWAVLLPFLMLFCLMLAIGVATAQTNTRYVSTTGTNTDPASATSWASSTTNLQGAIDAAGVTQVWVAAGVYKPTTTTGPASRTISFSMKNGVAIYGGFVGDETALSQRPASNPVTGQPSSSTLSGDIGTANDNSDNSNNIIRNREGLTTTAILDGFVLTGGKATGDRNAGGAIYNYSHGSGQFCNPTIRNCLFQDNSAYSGGAVTNTSNYTSITSPEFTNCLFKNNLGTNDGGAVANDGSTSGTSRPVFTNCSFQGNSSYYGGAFYNYASESGGNGSPVLINCSFQGNSADGEGGAFFNIVSYDATSRPVLFNCVFFNNGGAKTFSNENTSVSASYSLFEPSSIIASVDVSGPGNLTNVTNSPFASTTSMALAACSPAINAGNPASATAATGPYSETTLPAIDLAGNPRIVDGRVDMGAVEFQGTPVAISTQPAAGSAVCVGAIVSVPVGITGTVAGYQWYKDGTALVGQSTSALSLTNVQAGDAGSYSVVITGDCNSLTSTAFSLTVNDVASFTVNSLTVCVGQVANLQSSGCSGQVLWSTGATGSSLTMSVGTSTSVLTATCTVGSCSATASGSVMGLQPPASSINSLSADESACPVRLVGRATGTSFVFTGPNGYVFSAVYRTGGSYDLSGLFVKQPGVYTLSATYITACGSSVPVSQTVTVNRRCP